ncbi:MAG TPA: hypothetical protein VFB92_13440 [Vicinamibacterales bacterium]|nr:hypothetical protein [Vicinamibacterales bacterium]
MFHLVFVFGLAIVACSPKPEAPPVANSPAETKPAGKDVDRYTVDEGGRRQTLEVSKQTGNAVDVVITVDGACSRRETGSAVEDSTDGDSDVEVDPDGEGHPTDAFSLKLRDECSVGIRLAAPEREYAWLSESDCKSSCPLSEEPMTRK